MAARPGQRWVGTLRIPRRTKGRVRTYSDPSNPGQSPPPLVSLSKLHAGFLAVAGATAGATAAVHEWAIAQERVTMMDAALAQQGQLTDENREKYQELTSQLQKLTSIADEEWASVLAASPSSGPIPRALGWTRMP